MYVAMRTAAGPAKKAIGLLIKQGVTINFHIIYPNQLNTERNPSPVHCDLILRQHAVQIGTIYTLGSEPHTLNFLNTFHQYSLS